MAVQDEVVFEHTVAGLLRRGLAGKLTPRLVERLKAEGVDPDRLLPAYPRATWRRLLTLAREEAFPELSDDAAYHALGRRVVDGYVETLVGKAVVAMLRVVGPRRTLGRMTKTFRSAGNFSETRLTEEPDGSCRLWINEPHMSPAYYRGLLDAALSHAGAPGSAIEVASRDALGVTFAVRFAKAQAA